MGMFGGLSCGVWQGGALVCEVEQIEGKLVFSANVLSCIEVWVLVS